jgi:hypothetical protein
MGSQYKTKKKSSQLTLFSRHLINDVRKTTTADAVPERVLWTGR